MKQKLKIESKSTFLTAEDTLDIAVANSMQKQVNKLTAEIASLLQPILMRSVTRSDDEIEALIPMLPAFYRADLSKRLTERQNNKLILGDSLYELDAAYLEGANAMRSRIPYDRNPHEEGTTEADQWDYGHVNESAGEHIREDIDVVAAKRTGRTFKETVCSQ